MVLTPEVLALARGVARRWAGTLADVLRLAVPPRHARVEAEVWPAHTANPGPTGRGRAVGATRVRSTWRRHVGGAAFLRRVAAGENPRAVWQALPWTAQPWTDQVAEAVVAARRGGRGALVVVPSGAEVRLVMDALDRAGVPAWSPGAQGGSVRLIAEDGPAQRYRSFLAVARGVADVVVGTRAAAFAPLARPGLLICWDDGDPLHSDPRAPYPHAREVLAMRAEAGSALLVGGYVRSVAAQRWVAQGWAHPVVAERADVRALTPRPVHLDRVELAREGPAAGARLPSAAWRAIRDGLERGPVLVQVPRAGYLPAVACAQCRTVARCARVCRAAAARRFARDARLRVVRGAGRRVAVRSSAGTAACGPSRWAPSARPRSWAGRSPACRCAVPPPGRVCSPRCPTRAPWWWRRPVPNRWPTAATRRRCCWTPR